MGKSDIVAVANAAKVSISTVSRRFNHPHLVNPRTRTRIDRAVEKLGYIRNRAAQAMHGRRSGTIGFIVPTIDHAIFARLIQSFSDAIEDGGFTLLMTSHGYDLDREYAVLRKLLEHRVDGVALIGLEHSEATYNLLARQNMPVVALWNHRDDAPIACVGSRNTEAGRLAAAHLLDLGHREIATVFPNTRSNDRAHDRRTGALSLLGDAPESWRRESPYSIGQAKAVCLEILTAPHRPTAILCGNDVIAQGALHAAQKCGIPVPQRLSIMGIGDFKGSADLEPPLSTIHIPAVEIGTRAGALLMRMIASKAPADPSENCPPELRQRGTTRAPHFT